MKVILDTNILVSAGFNPDSSSAWLVQQLRAGGFRHVWNGRTRNEARRVLLQIPSLVWEMYADLFDPAEMFVGETDESVLLDSVAEEDDRKFVALARASGAVLVSNDSDLLGRRIALGVDMKTPDELRRG